MAIPDGKPVHFSWNCSGEDSDGTKIQKISVFADPDAEAFEADIVALARGDQIDRGDAEILQDLRAKADLAPFAFAAARLLMVLALAL